MPVLCSYLGGDHRQYPDYLDAATGRMLEVSPGGTYDVRVAPGRAEGLPLPPGDGRWGHAPALAALAAPEGGPEPGPPPEPESALPSLPGESAPGEPAPDDGGQPAPSNDEE